METISSISFRPSPLRRLPLNRASPPSIHLNGFLHRRVLKICLPSLAVIGYSPAVSSEYLQESTSSKYETKENSSEDEDLDQIHPIEVSDKLIEIFLVDKPNPSDWRKLLAFSKTWSETGPHFYDRCQYRADTETDPAMKVKLLKLIRKLKEVEDDLKRHNELLEAVKKNPDEINSIVAKRRKDFTAEFFIHFRDVAESYYQNQEKIDDMIMIGKACLAAVESYDKSLGNMNNVKRDEFKFDDLINPPILDINSRKIDDLTEKKQLDLSKAWSDAKESTLVEDEAKDIMFDMYMKGLGSIQQMIPKEVRIISYVLTIKDREELLAALNDAFTPSVEYQTDDMDYVWTTPKDLHIYIESMVHAFNAGKRDIVAREARDLLKPKIIKRLEELKKIIERNFL
ncbi:hypothetical protein LUZ60_012638 [Juncus effusus]|nr:hypothetical protein LUZ60_012638 [Juncus effusus]